MRTRKWLLSTVTAAILVTLGACGGGGGDPVPSLIAITEGNRDIVAHATAAGTMGLSPTGLIPITSGSAGAGMRQVLHAQVEKLAAQRERPLAVIGPVEEPCLVSGSVSMSVDDRDNNGLPSVGDAITLVFKSCSDSPGETVDGTSVTTLTGITVTGTTDVSLTGRMAMSQMSAVTSNHSATVNGTMLLDYSEVQTALVERTKVTAEGPVTVAVSTHLPFSDTVTLQDGFVVDDTYDGVLGRTVSTVGGSLHSAAAGGLVDVTTVNGAPITKYDTDVYPRSGVLQVTGKNSTLQIRALSAVDVRLDLDADGNGIFESTETKTWDWLL